MRAVVTGAAGFIGSALADRLLRDGHQVVGIDCLTDYYDRTVKLRNLRGPISDSRFALVERNLATDPLHDVMAGADVVFHQAGEPGVRGSWGAGFDRYISNNISATQRILEWILTSPETRLVYASSSSVYGNADKWPCHEHQEPRPFSPYGVTKLAAEHLVRAYATNFNLSTVSLRYFTVYGPRQRPDMLMHRLCESFLGRRTVDIYGGGTQVRDFTFVGDVVEANVRAADVARPGEGVVLNICGGSTVSIGDIVDILRHESGSTGNLREAGPQAGDVARTGGDNSAARELLGWVPMTGLEQGLAEQFAWHSRL